MLVAAGAALLSLGLVVACASFSAEPPAVAADAEADRPVPPGGDSGPDGGADAADDAEDPRAFAAGCSDGTREAFKNTDSGIAGCVGAWTIAGLLADADAGCARRSGNTSRNKKDGESCAAEDLCAFRWHVCRNSTDVITHGGATDICQNAAIDGGTFYATAQPSDGNATCGGTGVNDVFGCGDTPFAANACVPLNKVIGLGQGVALFNLGLIDSQERAYVTKAAGPGGVLCCRD